MALFESESLSPGDMEAACADVTYALQTAMDEVRRAGTADPLDASEFEAQVREFAAIAKAAGAPPERMIVLLRRCVEDTPGLPLEREERRAIWTRAFDWALEAYFDAD